MDWIKHKDPSRTLPTKSFDDKWVSPINSFYWGCTH